MIPLAFELRKWPRVHEHLVEECIRDGRALHVSDVLPYLTEARASYAAALISSWNPPADARQR